MAKKSSLPLDLFSFFVQFVQNFEEPLAEFVRVLLPEKKLELVSNLTSRSFIAYLRRRASVTTVKLKIIG